VDEETFWACARDGIEPNRGEPEATSAALPAELAHLLVTRLRLSGSEIAQMSLEQAIARMQEFWSQPD